MITYTLTKESMLQYLNRAIAEVTKQLAEEQAKLESTQTAFKVALDELYRDLNYELHDPEATVIKALTNNALAEFNRDFAYRPITKWLYSIMRSTVYNGTINEHVPVKNPESYITNDIRTNLSKELNEVSNYLLATDDEIYTFHWSSHSAASYYRKAKGESLIINCYNTRDLIKGIQSNIKSLTCKLTLLQRELVTTEFCESATFELTSECKL